MTTDRGALAALLATLAVMSATPTAAQTSPSEQTPQPAPVRGLEALAPPQQTQIPVPDAPKIVLPSTTPRTTTPSTPAPKATAKRPATSDRSATRATPAESATRAPSSAGDTNTTAEPRASTSSPTAAAPAPATTPEPVPTPTAPLTTTDAAPTTTPAPKESTLAAPETGRAMPLWLSLAVIVVVLAGLWFLRRRKPAARYDRAEPEVIAEPTPDPAEQLVTPQPPEPVATPVAIPVAVPVAALAVSAPTAPKFLEPRAKTPAPPPSPPAAPRARVTCELRPLRAGLNLLSATVECELVITNTGNAAAEAIRTGIVLLTAHSDQDADLVRFNAAPVVRPAAPPFALAPGETRTVRTVTAIAREAIHTMTAANRPMFVPVVATNILYTTAGDDAQTARAWVVGIERVDSAKLAPFWLDAPAKMFTMVAARPHAATFDR
ncbi:LPXTG cell wall anchor domain-containing protein [Sphingomonas sp. PB2P12]|uniref:LPXTG cell wall anchor domain-containing protein n=1 Tax=Sphingomonas sandaracina TaxID=3096157 RepID=UPI002FC6690F